VAEYPANGTWSYAVGRSRKSHFICRRCRHALPPTNGPVESLVANGSVIIVNQADQSRSTGDHAVYSREDNLFQLTGSPLWWNDRIKVQGETLNADVTNRICHARGHSRFEMRAAATPANCSSLPQRTSITKPTSRCFKLPCMRRFRRLECCVTLWTRDSLNVELVSNEAITAVARGNVRGQTAPDRMGNVKTITCASLTAHRSPVTLLMKDLIATNDVVLTQLGEPRRRAARQINRCFGNCRVLRRYESNLKQPWAQHDVVFEQIKPDQNAPRDSGARRL